MVNHSLFIVGIQNQKIIAATVVTTGDDYPEVDWPDQLPDEQIGVVHLVVVHPDYRGHGIATAFVQGALKAAKQHFQMLHLDVLANNLPAIKLYTKSGFHLVAKLVLHYDDIGDQDAIVMDCDLRK